MSVKNRSDHLLYITKYRGEICGFLIQLVSVSVMHQGCCLPAVRKSYHDKMLRARFVRFLTDAAAAVMG